MLVTVKSGATGTMAGLIARHAPSDAVVVSLQNGVGNVAVLRAHLGESARWSAAWCRSTSCRRAPMATAPRFHRATSGTLLIGAGIPACATLLDVPGMAVAERSDMDGVLWGKLVLNLNNALNALCGLPLAQELADARWRRLLAAQIEEALAVLKATGIAPAGVEGVPPRVIPFILRLPDWLFRRVARRMLAIDPAGPLVHVGGSGAAPADRDRLSAGGDPGAGRKVGRGGADLRARAASRQECGERGRGLAEAASRAGRRACRDHGSWGGGRWTQT